eukprot:TRINITY_DN533_c0_g1_i1.p1 TRINITY_DN533_c0_g1~~TRINITY_DN533_c0_g1_i1.p1  ORF type:complete len:385 (+),score=125.94 TRINITY_DN533_c0_g1_i1:54-1208(+)
MKSATAMRCSMRSLASQQMRRNSELAEFSVVYSDRALNHMSPTFIDVMTTIDGTLKKVYNADHTAVVPGSGTYGMEAVARLAKGKKVIVMRNGFFSFRWSQIFEMGQISDDVTVLEAVRADSDNETPAFTHHPIDDVLASIQKEKPAFVIAPHVETSAGLIISNETIKKMADATHAVGGMFVLDCIASGACWADMKELGVDFLLSAPQKGWTAPPCAGLVMMSEKAREVVESTPSSSFSIDLKKWTTVMDAYVKGGHMYHATMPTEALRTFAGVLTETEKFGFDKAAEAQRTLGANMRSMLKEAGYKSIAADEVAAPTVAVSYGGPEIVGKMKAQGIQIAGGVPLMVASQPATFNTWRLGFFGLDKLAAPDQYVQQLAAAVKSM